MLNRRGDVTGVLVYTGSFFAQILEGAQETIDPLIARILKDPRHVDGRVLLSKVGLAQRTFGDWSMDLFEGPSLEGLVARIYESPPDEMATRSAELLDSITALARGTWGPSTMLDPGQFHLRVSTS